ncbi:MAG TPA: BadF/BadG/BcrA/BcrD ATPase family protein [Actinopolymorphaceae bacterium]|jgi:N-acetylglucosamine kinase-like BadF-type ATPase
MSDTPAFAQQAPTQQAASEPSSGVRIAVDGGATTLIMSVLGGDRVEVPGFQWTSDEDPVEQQCRRVGEAWEALGKPSPVEVIALGLAGGAYDRPSRERLAPMIAERLGAGRVLLTGDDVTTHLGVLGGEPGVVVAAGTGVACLAVTPDGELINVDGLGYLFGDAGGGFSLGLAGLRAALAAFESRGAPTELVERAERRVGKPLREAVKAWYRSPSLIADVASFAAEVTEAAATDSVARVLCVSAGEELAVSAAAAVRRGFPAARDQSVPVSWAGGVLRAKVIFDAFADGLAQLCPAARLREPVGDSLGGAVRLASNEQVPHLSAVVTYVAASPQ